MNMKNKLKLFSLATLLLILGMATSGQANTVTNTAPVTETPEQRAAILKDRLEEIKAIDKKKLTRKEKKALRTEVKMIRHELAQISGGVYLSVGAIVLIVLLILLLA